MARACRYRPILRRTRQEKCHGEERKRELRYITFLKGFLLMNWQRPVIWKLLIWILLSPKYLPCILRITEEWVPFSMKLWLFHLGNINWKIKVSQDSCRFYTHAASLTSPLMLVFNLEAQWPGALFCTNVSYKTRVRWFFF